MRTAEEGEHAVEKSFYSYHFVILKYMGCWVIDSQNPRTLNAYVAFRTVLIGAVSILAFFVFLDFSQKFGDLRNMSWNLSVNMLLAGGFLKNAYYLDKSTVINGMRRKLHWIAISRTTDQDKIVDEVGEKEMKRIRAFFYSGVCVVLPLWLLSYYFSYLWGPRELPVPIYLPFYWDEDDDVQYYLIFATLAIMGCVVVEFVIESEMAMFTLLVQISREYNRLLKDLKNTKEEFEDETKYENAKAEVNPVLRESRIKQLLKKHFTDHQLLIQCTKDFEGSYSLSLLLQFFLVMVATIFLSMLCMLERGNISLNICFQIGFIALVVVDCFLLCWYCSRINGQCHRVGIEAYSIPWYGMTTDIQKDISMMVVRSQHPPKITVGKLLEANLNAFLLLIRTTYSCLAVCKQLMPE